MRSVWVLEAAATEAAEAAGWYEAQRDGLGAGLRSEFKLALDSTMQWALLRLNVGEILGAHKPRQGFGNWKQHRLRDISAATLRFFDAGHFALETHAVGIAATTREFLGSAVSAQSSDPEGD